MFPDLLLCGPRPMRFTILISKDFPYGDDNVFGTMANDVENNLTSVSRMSNLFALPRFWSGHPSFI